MSDMKRLKYNTKKVILCMCGGSTVSARALLQRKVQF